MELDPNLALALVAIATKASAKFGSSSIRLSDLI